MNIFVVTSKFPSTFRYRSERFKTFFQIIFHNILLKIILHVHYQILIFYYLYYVSIIEIIFKKFLGKNMYFLIVFMNFHEFLKYDT